MTQPNDSILMTPGTGAQIATHTASGKKLQAMMMADERGHILGTQPLYHYMITTQQHISSANGVHWDMFNADASLIVRVLSIIQLPNIVATVTGIPVAWKLSRSSTVGTGGTAQTAWLADTNDAALDADITCRSKPTGGATEDTILRDYQLHSDEANPATLALVGSGGLELVPEPLRLENGGMGIVLRQNQGLRVTQITGSTAGNTAWAIGFTVH